MLVTWASPTEVDYAQTRVWIGAADQQNPTYHYIKGSEIEIETALTGSQTDRGAARRPHRQLVHSRDRDGGANAVPQAIRPSGFTGATRPTPRLLPRRLRPTPSGKNDNYLPTGWARHELAPLSVYRFVYGTYRTKARTATQWTEYQQTLTLVDSARRR